uniref:Hematopoietic cell-specific Lyn substrate 1 n=1 Tax=Nothobranchius furzeri TaxID=105023 RepID=A0A8C6NMS5_NOTFU
MWKSVVGHNVSVKVAAAEGDDWETDPDFVNDVSEQEQRWGAKTIEGSGRKEHISVAELRNKVAEEHEQVKQKDETPKASYGYGGKFGVEKDRMDKEAVGHEYVAQVEQHSSQKDMAKGFGGKFGVQKDRVDKSAMGFEYKGEVQQHASQKDYAKGFGGKYGVEKERVDKAALGYEYKGETEKHQSQKDYAKGFGGKYGVEKEKVDKAAVGYDYRGETEKHQSQKDYSKGFGGKYGVEKEKVDKSALGYDYKGDTEKHQSQKDYSTGFGGRYGVQTDRMDKSAAGFSEVDAPTSAYEKTKPVEASSAGTGKLKARFENMAKTSDEENWKKAEEEKARRQARERREQEEAERRQQEQDSRKEDFQPPPVVEEPEYDIPAPEILYHMPEIQEIPEPEPEVRHEHQKTTICSKDVGYVSHLKLKLGMQLQFTTMKEVRPVLCSSWIVSLLHLLAKSGLIIRTEADDEISFNPDDIITDIEMIDEGWWKGMCHGRVGLFPAAYVQLK